MVTSDVRSAIWVVGLLTIVAGSGMVAGPFLLVGAAPGGDYPALLDHNGSDSEVGTHLDENLSVYRTHWTGQQLGVSADRASAGAVFQIRNYTDGRFGGLVTEFTLDDDATSTLDTSRLGAGQYVIVDHEKSPRAPANGTLTPVSTAEHAWWEVAVQTLDVRVEDHSFGEPMPLDIRSNRGSYHLEISSPQLNASDLVRVLPDDRGIEPLHDDMVLVPASADATLMVDLRDIPPGEYALDVRVRDTGIGDTVTITRAEPEEVANVEQEVIQSTRGAVPTIQVNLQDTDMADISLGAEGVDYRTSFTAIDGNGDGVVAFRFNSYRAGWTGTEAGAFEPVDEADELQDIRRETPRRSDGLPAGDYEITVSVDGEVTDLATLVLSEQTIGDIEIRIAPDVGFSDDPEQVERATIPADSVALEDGLVFHLEADGLGGLFQPGYELAPGSPGGSDDGVSFEIAPANGSDRSSIDLATGTTIPDGAGGVYFAIPVEPDPVGFEADTNYTATFELSTRSPLVSEPLARSTNLTVEARRADFDERQGDVVTLSSSGSSLITNGEMAMSGTTSVAPGSELVVVFRSDDPLVVEDATAVVTARREWEVEFDIPTEVDNYTVHVRDGPDTISDHVLAVEPVETEPEQTTGEMPGDGDEPDDEDDGLPVHPALIVVGGALVAGWAVIRYRGPIRSAIQREPDPSAGDDADATEDAPTGDGPPRG